MSFIAGYQAAIYFATNASSVSLPANDVLTDSGDHTTYGEAVAAHRYWDDSAVPTVQIDTVGDGAHYVTASPSTYTVQYVGGKVIFASPNTSATLVRLSTGGKYFAYATYALGTAWDLSGTATMLNTSVLSGDRAKSFLPGQFGGVFTMKGFWIDNTFLTNIQTGFRLIFSGSVDGTKRFESYTYTQSDKVITSVSGTVDEQMSFQVTGAWYYN